MSLRLASVGSIVIALALGITGVACGERSTNLKTYEATKYRINYPSDWLISEDSGIANLYPSDDQGAVTISVRSNVTFSLAETTNFILELDGSDDSQDSVKRIDRGEYAEFTHESVDKKNAHWFTKVIRRQGDFYLITINCYEPLWGKNKGMYFSIIDSFEMKK